MNEQDVVQRNQLRYPVDITAMATDFGITVYESYDLPPGISGKIARDSSSGSSGYAITVAASDSYRRKRFTIAHECAHYLLHRDKIGDGLLDDALYRSDKMTTREEFDANNKAAELIMPSHLIMPLVRSGFGTLQMADFFQVSKAAMEVRLNYLLNF